MNVHWVPETQIACNSSGETVVRNSIIKMLTLSVCFCSYALFVSIGLISTLRKTNFLSDRILCNNYPVDLRY